MSFATTITIALALAMDAFAVSLGIGSSGRANSTRPVFRVSYHMGLFQGLMTFLGWLVGSEIARFIASIDHWVAMALLAFVGVNMMRSGLSGAEDVSLKDPSRGGTLIMLCVACSIDALAVGFSLAIIQLNIVLSSLTIGGVTLGLSLIGLLAGSRLGNAFGKRMEILGGLLLNGIGLRILIIHLF